MRKRLGIREKRYLAAQFLMIAAVVSGLFLVTTKSCIWFDESFTINLVRRKVPELIRLTGLDVHPPLYYLAVRLCILLLGENVFSLYMTSILCYGAMLVVTVFFFHRYFSPEISLFVTTAFCALPNMLIYAIQLRMYSMAMLFVTVSFYLAYCILCQPESEDKSRRNRKLFLLALSNVLAAYTHYFAGVAAVGISLFVLGCLLRRREHRGRAFLNWCVYCGVMFLMYLPWLPVMLRQMSAIDGDYWISPVTWASVRSYGTMLFNEPARWLKYLMFGFYLIGAVLFFLRFSAEDKNVWMLGGYGVILFWLAFGIGYSLVRTPILIDRYVMVLLPLAWLPVLAGYARSPGRLVRAGALFVLAVCLVYNYADLYREYVAYSQWDLREYIEANFGPEDIFFHYDVQALSMCEAYFPQMEHWVVSGADSGQAFRHWTELLECGEVDSVKSLSDMDMDGNIWCLNGSCELMFEKMGYEVELIELESQAVFRIHR